MKKLIFFLVCFMAFGVTPIANADPGRTDSSGGHICRTNCEDWDLTTGEYHVHSVVTAPILESEPEPAPTLAPEPEPEPTPAPSQLAPAPTQIEAAPEPEPDLVSEPEEETTEAQTWEYKGGTYDSAEGMKAAKKADEEADAEAAAKEKAKRKKEEARAREAILEKEASEKEQAQEDDEGSSSAPYFLSGLWGLLGVVVGSTLAEWWRYRQKQQLIKSLRVVIEEELVLLRDQITDKKQLVEETKAAINAGRVLPRPGPGAMNTAYKQHIAELYESLSPDQRKELHIIHENLDQADITLRTLGPDYNDFRLHGSARGSIWQREQKEFLIATVDDLLETHEKTERMINNYLA